MFNYAVENNEIFNWTFYLFCLVRSVCFGERISQVPHKSFVGMAVFWGSTMGGYFDTEYGGYVSELWRNIRKYLSLSSISAAES